MAQVEIRRRERIDSTPVRAQPRVQTLDIAEGLDALLADSFALYMKTKNVHWRLGGPRAFAYDLARHLEFDEHADQLFHATDLLAERVRELGGTSRPPAATGRDMARRYVRPGEMLEDLSGDNRSLLDGMKHLRGRCEQHADAASAALLSSLIEDGESRAEFLAEIADELGGI